MASIVSEIQSTNPATLHSKIEDSCYYSVIKVIKLYDENRIILYVIYSLLDNKPAIEIMYSVSLVNLYGNTNTFYNIIFGKYVLLIFNEIIIVIALKRRKQPVTKALS